ncbi:hypothetical protein [Anabaena sp. PCC 7108]|uniref:hypothetical protein n=1 Tax=Anabaena sp. PCC 7108 TaxID=163908 RepID=UPI0003458011|nr:hypothetical protein [Anabaena sp. PCC 7108]
MITPEQVLLALQENQGANNGLRAKDLVELLTGYASKASDERYLRQVVSALRIQGFPILATPERGYYWPTDVNEIEVTCFWLRKRAMTHLWMVSKLKRFGIPMLTGQLTLPIPVVIPAIPQMDQPNEEEAKEQVQAIFMVVPQDIYESVVALGQKTGKTDEEIASMALAVFVSGCQELVRDMEITHE